MGFHTMTMRKLIILVLLFVPFAQSVVSSSRRRRLGFFQEWWTTVKEIVKENTTPLEADGNSANSAPFSYIGCYRDDNQRDLDHKNGFDPWSKGPGTCSFACKDYVYFAIQAGHQCWCGDAYSTEAKYSKVADSECKVRLIGDTLQYTEGDIGNGWRNAVFSHGYEPIGCYTDNKERDLDHYVGNGRNPYRCSIDCNGYKYFALQYGGECYCANSYGNGPAYTPRPSHECKKGHRHEHFGSDWRNFVFKKVDRHKYPANFGGGFVYHLVKG